MVIRTLVARGRDRLVGFPGGGLVVKKEVVGGGRDVARMLVDVGGRVVGACERGVSGEKGRGKRNTVWERGGGAWKWGRRRCGGLD